MIIIHTIYQPLYELISLFLESVCYPWNYLWIYQLLLRTEAVCAIVPFPCMHAVGSEEARI